MTKELRKKNEKTLILASQYDLEEVVQNAIDKALKKQSDEADALITREEAAKKLDVDFSTLWRWNKEGFLLSVKSGRNVRYRLSDIEKILKGRLND